MKNIGSIIPTGVELKIKYSAVKDFFSLGGPFALNGLTEVFALNLNMGYVFVRFHAKNYKFKTEQ